jgi:cytochrome P450
MPQAIEEAIRWESPLLITSRLAMADAEVGGVQAGPAQIAAPKPQIQM